MDDDYEREEMLAALVTDCIISHNEAIIVKLLAELEKQYQELARLSTMGEYKSDWTHKQVLDYVTYET